MLAGFVGFLYNGIKQHDVNILMLRVLRCVRDVCVLRFFLSVFKKLPCQKETVTKFSAGVKQRVFVFSFFLFDVFFA